MPHYSVVMYDDMGHMVIDKQDTIPRTICEFCYAKATQYLRPYYKEGPYTYGLLDALQPRWTYEFGENTVEIEWKYRHEAELLADGFKKYVPTNNICYEAFQPAYVTTTRSMTSPSVGVILDDGNRSNYGLPSGGMSSF